MYVHVVSFRDFFFAFINQLCAEITFLHVNSILMHTCIDHVHNYFFLNTEKIVQGVLGVG